MSVSDFRRPIFPLGNSKYYFETGDVTGCEGARREAENYELYARRLPLPPPLLGPTPSLCAKASKREGAIDV